MHFICREWALQFFLVLGNGYGSCAKLEFLLILHGSGFFYFISTGLVKCIFHLFLPSCKNMEFNYRFTRHLSRLCSIRVASVVCKSVEMLYSINLSAKLWPQEREPIFNVSGTLLMHFLLFFKLLVISLFVLCMLINLLQ